VTRRPVLPGAAELFRRTDTPEPPAAVTELPSLASATSSPALRGTPARRDPDGAEPAHQLALVPDTGDQADPLAGFRAPAPPRPATVRGRPAAKRADGRTRHEEKITVYLSAEDLLALESARLTLRAEHGVAADRGRIVREAVTVLLADLAERGADSVLARRLAGPA
jgi:hypothetical protein